MLTEIPTEEYAETLDACAGELLWEAAVFGPPVDAFVVAERLGLVVATNQEIDCRARFVRLAECGAASGGAGGGQGTIVVCAAERPEREQWAIAHEIGESVAHRVFERLRVRPERAPPTARERVANQLASCILLPRRRFAADGRGLDWDLLALKERYTTASHELIARRMLEMGPPIVITVCDQGRVAWRRSNTAGRPPRLTPPEHDAWQDAHTCGIAADETLDPYETGLARVRAWPVHEPEWKREIVRSDVAEI